MKEFLIKNAELSDDSYSINQYISMKKYDLDNKETLVQISEENTKYQNTTQLFFRALQISLTKIHLKIKEVNKSDSTYGLLESFTRPMINYYIKEFDNNNIVSLDEISTIKITKEDVQSIIKNFEIICEYSKRKNEDNNKNITRWDYAYNQYLNACASITIEVSIITMVTGMESLLVNGNGELTYKVSLNSSLITADSKEERKEIYKLVKNMYNLRSKVVHGEVKEVINKLSSENIYNDYFKLKDLFSKILIKTYNYDEKELFEKIDDMIFNCPKF